MTTSRFVGEVDLESAQALIVAAAAGSTIFHSNAILTLTFSAHDRVDALFDEGEVTIDTERHAEIRIEIDRLLVIDR